ncbi:MAG: L,D-transpeptidase [Pseudolabrys sp.]
MRIRIVTLASPLLAAAALMATTQLSSAQSLFAAFDAPRAVTAQPAAPAYDEMDAIEGEDAQLPANLQRQIVNYDTREAPGTVIIDTPHTYLYLVLGDGKAMRYGIGVGREGFTWAGVQHIARKAEWPDWHPPAEMIARQPYLPRFTAGGPGNPLGARAMYLGNTMYRIHGTNDPTTIGKQVSSGCIRLTNDDVIDLFNRVQMGAKVVVLPQTVQARAKTRTHEHLAAQRATDDVSSYAPQPAASRAARTWATISPGIY